MLISTDIPVHSDTGRCVTPVQDNTFLFQFIVALSHVMFRAVRFLISETIKNLNKPFCAHMTHDTHSQCFMQH